jgi:hypothetical protein
VKRNDEKGNGPKDRSDAIIMNDATFLRARNVTIIYEYGLYRNII